MFIELGKKLLRTLNNVWQAFPLWLKVGVVALIGMATWYFGGVIMQIPSLIQAAYNMVPTSVLTGLSVLGLGLFLLSIVRDAQMREAPPNIQPQLSPEDARLEIRVEKRNQQYHHFLKYMARGILEVLALAPNAVQPFSGLRLALFLESHIPLNHLDMEAQEKIRCQKASRLRRDNSEYYSQGLLKFVQEELYKQGKFFSLHQLHTWITGFLMPETRSAALVAYQAQAQIAPKKLSIEEARTALQRAGFREVVRLSPLTERKVRAWVDETNYEAPSCPILLTVPWEPVVTGAGQKLYERAALLEWYLGGDLKLPLRDSLFKDTIPPYALSVVDQKIDFLRLLAEEMPTEALNAQAPEIIENSAVGNQAVVRIPVVQAAPPLDISPPPQAVGYRAMTEKIENLQSSLIAHHGENRVEEAIAKYEEAFRAEQARWRQEQTEWLQAAKLAIEKAIREQRSKSAAAKSTSPEISKTYTPSLPNAKTPVLSTASLETPLTPQALVSPRARGAQ